MEQYSRRTEQHAAGEALGERSGEGEGRTEEEMERVGAFITHSHFSIESSQYLSPSLPPSLPVSFPPQVAAAIAALTPAEIEAFQTNGSLTVAGYELSGEELLLKKAFKGDTSIFQAESSQDGTLLVVLDTRQDERVLAQATARELVNRVQKLRKRVGLKLTDVVEIYYETADKGIQEVRTKGGRRGRKMEEGRGSHARFGTNCLITSFLFAIAFVSERRAHHISSPSLPSSPQALSSNAAMVQSTLRVFPLPASLLKPAHAVELGSEQCTINDAPVTVFVTRPTISLCEESILKVVGGKESKAAGVSGFVASMGYERLKEAGKEGGEMAFVLDGEEVRLSMGEHYFMSATHKARAKALLPELAALAVTEGEREEGNGGEKK